MFRYALKIEYDGSNYHGWQIQKNHLTVQGRIQDAFSNFTILENGITGSGRTDTGVHATGQIAHVDLREEWSPQKLQDALNFFLKNSAVSILEVMKVPMDFHARFSAKERYYEYKISVRDAPLALERQRCWHLRRPQNIHSMRLAAKHLKGTHDFTTFRSSICQSKSPIKTLDYIQIEIEDLHVGYQLILKFKARSFLHNQIRSIVGSLEKVGSEKWKPEHIFKILKDKDRSSCGPVAPPYGLYLTKVTYDQKLPLLLETTKR